jgi:hypothetical protein
MLGRRKKVGGKKEEERRLEVGGKKEEGRRLEGRYHV